MSRQLGWLFICLTAGCYLAGCNGSGGDYKTAGQIKQEKKASGQPVHADHEDHGPGPHGGAIVELGDDEYHAEVVVDGKTHTLLVYLLGPDAKTATAIAATEATVMTEGNQSLTLKAAPQKGDADGKASKFELTDEAAVDALVKAKSLHGDLQIEIDGKPFRGHIDAHFDGSSHDDHKDDEKEMPPETTPDDDTPKDDDATDKPAETPEK